MLDIDRELLLAKWLENNLNEQERQTFEYLCLHDKRFSQHVETANSVAFTAQQFEQSDIPAWDKESTFIATERVKWWQWSGMPVTSMAMSVLAIAMVVTGFNIHVEAGRITMGFQSAPSQAQMTALVDTKIADYQQANQAMFSQYVEALTAQQQQSSAQLTEYLLSSSRQERREDFAELIKFINEQREDDQRFYARQLNSLQQEIYSLDTPYQDPLLPVNDTLNEE
ncbi:hypothetical protein [Agaribacter flavus]|uniref:Anti-sigma factor n=1 Tax=Agaribacter flavus TaxID=1902781 RepID=A0ABV7FJ30_9ALTE